MGHLQLNYYRREVCSFLNSAAALWMDVYHCDGIRMDAISRALYWQGDVYKRQPLNIYELHAGSWKHKPNATREDGSDGWYNYRELARELIPWLLDHRCV